MAQRQDASTGQVIPVDDLPKDKFHLKVYSPFRVYYEGVVSCISAENGTGPFDILAQHHNFITLLSPGDLVIRGEMDDKTPEKISITRGIMQVTKNQVIVFLDV